MILTDLGARWDLAAAAFTIAAVLLLAVLVLFVRLTEQLQPSDDERAADERSLDSVRAGLSEQQRTGTADTGVTGGARL